MLLQDDTVVELLVTDRTLVEKPERWLCTMYTHMRFEIALKGCPLIVLQETERIPGAKHVSQANTDSLGAAFLPL